MDPCPICHARPECGGATDALYVAAGAVAEKVDALLGRAGVGTMRRDGLFTFAVSGDRERAIEALKELTPADKHDIRVAPVDLAAFRSAPTLDRYLALQEADWFDRALHDQLFRPWFQPIVDLSTIVVFAHECLIRLDGREFRNGGEIVQAAIARGHVTAFDNYARQLAIREGGLQHEPGTYLFINVFPCAVCDPECAVRSMCAALRRTSLRPSDVVLEVAHSAHVTDAARLRRICDSWRREGFGIALDNVGVGSGATRMLSDLRPDFIKLDRSLVQQVTSPTAAAMIRGFAEKARKVHVPVIATGVETAAMAELIQSCGIYLAQGWHFGRPAREMRANTGAALARLMQQLGGQLEVETVQLL